MRVADGALCELFLGLANLGIFFGREKKIDRGQFFNCQRNGADSGKV